MANNLRVIYNNLADTATITATTTASGFPTTNMQTDVKGQAWRSTSAISNTITLTWATDQAISAVILPFTNLSTTATVNITLLTSTSTTIYTTGTITAVPYTVNNWANIANGINTYSYGGGTAVRMYTPVTTYTNVRSITITIVDSGSTQGYLEVGRVICGTYWSPKYNTQYGLSVDFTDTSSHSRSQAGNIVTDVGPVYKTLTFDMSYMDSNDRTTLAQIMRNNAKRTPIFVSLFPSDADVNREFLYQIYGKLSNSMTISHPMYTQYASSVTIEEV